MNLLLDSSVLLDFIGRKEPSFTYVKRVVASGFYGKAKLWVPAQCLSDLAAVLSERVEPANVQDALLRITDVITPADLTFADIQRALRLSWQNYEDCLIAICAEKVRADFILSNDVQKYERSMVPAVTPEAWLELIGY